MSVGRKHRTDQGCRTGKHGSLSCLEIQQFDVGLFDALAFLKDDRLAVRDPLGKEHIKIAAGKDLLWGAPFGCDRVSCKTFAGLSPSKQDLLPVRRP